MKKEIIISSILSIVFSVLIMSSISYVFSWSEPASVPSEYDVPINTSATGQAKYGELSVALLRDIDNQSYYVNPSGTTILSQLQTQGLSTTTLQGQTITATSDVCLSSGICLSQLVELDYLVYSEHTIDQCTAAGGTVVYGEGIDRFCKISGSACPSSWTQYENWSTTVVPTCSCACTGSGCCSGSYTATSVCGSTSYVAVSCSGLHHTWSNTAKESVSAGAKGGSCAWYDCCCCNIYAQITQIGCY